MFYPLIASTSIANPDVTLPLRNLSSSPKPIFSWCPFLTSVQRILYDALTGTVAHCLFAYCHTLSEESNSAALHNTITMHALKNIMQLQAVPWIHTVGYRNKTRLVSCRNSECSKSSSLHLQNLHMAGLNLTYLKDTFVRRLPDKCNHPTSCFYIHYQPEAIVFACQPTVKP